MTGLERRCRWLLRAYPAWYRRERSEEMLGALLEASPPGRRWPTFRDARALVTGGLRVRGWVWLLSMLWVGAGAIYAGYFFYLTTKPYPGVDLGIAGWAEIPVTLQIVIALATIVLVCGTYSSADCRVYQASRLAGQSAPRSRVGRRVDCGRRSVCAGR